MSEKSGNGSFLAGFLAGAIAGAIAAFLYAPKTGEETRSALKGKKVEILGKTNISVDDAYKQAESAALEARDRFETLASSLRRRAEEFMRRGQVILEEQINNSKKTVEELEPEQAEILMPDVEPEAAEPEPEAAGDSGEEQSSQEE